MRHLPHGNNKWILHCVDHWSKFNFAYALDAKTASNVAGILNTHIFPYFGVPRILHSDNGREFVNMVIVDLLSVGTPIFSWVVVVLDTHRVRD